MLKKIALLAAVLSFSTGAADKVARDVTGFWTLPGDTRIEVSKCGGNAICAKIVSLKEPNYLSEKFGKVGTPKLDHMNPDSTLRSRPLIGLSVASGLTPKGEDRWVGGQCYDPDKGKTYKCKLRMIDAARLELRGYVGISLLGRTTVLVRAAQP